VSTINVYAYERAIESAGSRNDRPPVSLHPGQVTVLRQYLEGLACAHSLLGNLNQLLVDNGVFDLGFTSGCKCFVCLYAKDKKET
jgi:hypothetical protein